MTQGVECKQLFDEAQHRHGLAIYHKDNPDTFAVTANYLRSLIAAAGVSSKSFQLLLPVKLDRALRKDLNSYFFVAVVKEVPDFIRVELRAPLDVHENQKYYADLTEFFERLRPGIARRSQGIAQLIVQYPGFFEPDQIVQRIPYRSLERSAGEDDQVKVYFTANAKRERLNVLFLMNTGVKSYTEVAALVNEWLVALERHPDVYGSIKAIEELSSWEIENSTHAQMLLDATHLRADGFNLLVLMLDNLNRADLIVRYLVCGELAQSF
jgi:hypothetical protein